MKRPRVEAGRWLAQAESDLRFAELGLREGFYAQTCFTCQQAVEKALKAVHYLGGARVVVGHSLVELLKPLTVEQPALAEFQAAARQLDQYYIPTRYPNGLPGGVPAEIFTERQAAEAVDMARGLLSAARAIIG